jgi:hypothetical protein
MFVEFDTLPGEARIWIYQAERALTSGEQDVVLATGRHFIDQWASHGAPLTASIKIFKAYFVVIGVDDRMLPSGCSIDASAEFMRELGSKLNLDFFGRTNIPVFSQDQITLVPLSEIKHQVKNGQISQDTMLVNTLVQNKRGLEDWIVPLKSSWLSRYLPQPHG